MKNWQQEVQYGNQLMKNGLEDFPKLSEDSSVTLHWAFIKKQARSYTHKSILSEDRIMILVSIRKKMA